MCNGNDIGQIVLVMPFALFSKTEVQNEINQHFNKYRANVKLLRAKKKKKNRIFQCAKYFYYIE